MIKSHAFSYYLLGDKMNKPVISKTLYISILFFALVVVLSLIFLPTKKDILKTEYISSNDKEAIYVLNNSYLTKTSIYVNSEKPLEKVKKLINAMIIDNKDNNLLPEGFHPVLPSDTKVIDIKISGDILKIYFDKGLKDRLNEQMIEALTYTMTDLDGILGLEIYIDKNIVKYIANKELPTLLTKDFGINKKYDINNYNDINKVTIYYITNVDEGYYYVPVTKFVNDKRSKIEIIVDELSSNYIYESNLMSFLNSNARLISYEMKDKTLELVFNNMFFNENLEKSVLEEVVYSISYSMFDSCDVDSVLFIVDDQEIIKKDRKNLNN